MLNEEFGSNMFCSVLAVRNEDAFPILVDIGFLPLFFGDDDADSTSEYLDVADVLFFSGPVLLRYNLSSLTLGWKAVP